MKGLNLPALAWLKIIKGVAYQTNWLIIKEHGIGLTEDNRLGYMPVSFHNM